MRVQILLMRNESEKYCLCLKCLYCCLYILDYRAPLHVEAVLAVKSDSSLL